MKWLSRQARRLVSARILGPALLFALLFLRFTDPASLQDLRLRAFDIFQIASPRVATQRPVVIVDIDEESLRKLGQWPWPRTRVAELIARLTELGAATIGFDVIFAETDHPDLRRCRSRARAVHDHPRTRCHRSPRADGHAGSRQHRAITDVRDSSSRDWNEHSHDPDGSRRYPKCVGPGGEAGIPNRPPW